MTKARFVPGTRTRTSIYISNNRRVGLGTFVFHKHYNGTVQRYEVSDIVTKRSLFDEQQYGNAQIVGIDSDQRSVVLDADRCFMSCLEADPNPELVVNCKKKISIGSTVWIWRRSGYQWSLIQKIVKSILGENYVSCCYADSIGYATREKTSTLFASKSDAMKAFPDRARSFGIALFRAGIRSVAKSRK